MSAATHRPVLHNHNLPWCIVVTRAVIFKDPPPALVSDSLSRLHKILSQHERKKSNTRRPLAGKFHKGKATDLTYQTVSASRPAYPKLLSTLFSGSRGRVTPTSRRNRDTVVVQILTPGEGQQCCTGVRPAQPGGCPGLVASWSPFRAHLNCDVCLNQLPPALLQSSLTRSPSPVCSCSQLVSFS